MPTLTNSDTTNIAQGVVRNQRNQRSWGISTLHRTMIAKHQPYGPEDSVAERVLLVGIARIPGHEELGPVCIADDQRGRENQLAHVLQVRDRDQIFQPAKPAQGTRRVITIASPEKIAPVTK